MQSYPYAEYETGCWLNVRVYTALKALAEARPVASGALEAYAWLLPLSPDTPPSMTYYGSTLASPLRKVALSPISCGYQEYRGARPSVERAEQALGLVVRCALA